MMGTTHVIVKVYFNILTNGNKLGQFFRLIKLCFGVWGQYIFCPAFYRSRFPWISKMTGPDVNSSKKKYAEYVLHPNFDNFLKAETCILKTNFIRMKCEIDTNMNCRTYVMRSGAEKNPRPSFLRMKFPRKNIVNQQ